VVWLAGGEHGPGEPGPRRPAARLLFKLLH
jgi:hypothetical protein